MGLFSLSALLVLSTLCANGASDALLHHHHFHYPSLLAVCPVFLTVLASALAQARSGRARRAPLISLTFSGGIIFLSTWAGSRAQLALPTAVFLAAKSCRLVACMLVGALWQRKVYQASDGLSAALAMGGLALTLGVGGASGFGWVTAAAPAGVSSSALDSGLSGAALCGLSLLADGVFSTFQEAILWQTGADTSEVAAWSHGTALGLMLAHAAAQGSVSAEGLRAAASSQAIAACLLLLSLSGWASTMLVLAIVREWGTVKASFSLTVAKALSVALALSISPRPVLPSQMVGILLVFASVVISCLPARERQQLAATQAEQATDPVLHPLARARGTSSFEVLAAQERSGDSLADEVDAAATGDGLRRRRAAHSSTHPPSEGLGGPSLSPVPPTQPVGLLLAVGRSPAVASADSGAGRSLVALAPTDSARLRRVDSTSSVGSPLDALRRIATASCQTLDVLSSVVHIERPAIIYDSLSPQTRPVILRRSPETSRDSSCPFHPENEADRRKSPDGSPWEWRN